MSRTQEKKLTEHWAILISQRNSVERPKNDNAICKLILSSFKVHTMQLPPNNTALMVAFAEAFEGIEVTGKMALKTGENLLSKH